MPKFKIGDWIILHNNHNSIYQIEDIASYHYVLRHIRGGSMHESFDHEDSMCLWSFGDAESGDVLVDDIGCSMIFMLKDKFHLDHGLVKPNDYHSLCYLVRPRGRFCVNGWHHRHNVRPATYLERNFLFKKMYDAGYVLDSENKLKQVMQLKIDIPEGYEIDREKSDLTHLYLKKKNEEKRWRDDENAKISGYWLTEDANIVRSIVYNNVPQNHTIFATKAQAKSALAMARISQIMVHDKRFGGVVTDDEWNDEEIEKHCISRTGQVISTCMWRTPYKFLAFHTSEQRHLFMKENMDLIRDYFMLPQND